MSPLRVALPIASLLLAACVTSSSSDSGHASRVEIPKSLQWYRTSAEMRAVYWQTYRAATAQLPALKAGLAPGTWAVVLDADETVLDNTEYRLELAAGGQSYSSETFARWALESRAAALPGAKQFIEAVRAAGGRVVIVTNREEHICQATRQNFIKLEIPIDGVLCAAPGGRDKNPRFEELRIGKSRLELPPLRLVAFVGDNIQDFPGRSQSQPGPWSDFGESFFVLPNPMYGSWESNE
jgi:5'-nucleotidase (lipoprotein e(P4) family)